MTLFPGVAFVTGAASGIGQAVALSFAREGCRKIAIADRDEEGLVAATRAALQIAEDARVVSYTIDVAEESQVQSVIEAVAKDFGRIDYAVNAAGILSNNQRSHDTLLSTFDKINSVNYRGCWLTSRAEISQMLKQDALPTHDGRPGNRGSIVNFASQLGIVGRPAAAPYCASKAAVISMTQCDAIDVRHLTAFFVQFSLLNQGQYSKDSIRVNCVCPGVIDTPMTRPNMDVLGPAIAIAPMNRPGTAQEVADAVLFLSSSKATFVQGAAMVVDGGYTIN